MACGDNNHTELNGGTFSTKGICHWKLSMGLGKGPRK